jgi:hypothetical protein
MSSVRIAVLEALELIARNAYRYNLDLYEVLEQNQKKLRDRKERGVLKGSGDNR